MMLAADYAHAVAYLDRARLPAYVSFVEQGSAHGIAGDWEKPERVYVRTSDGVVVKGVPPSSANVNGSGSADPFGKDWVFRPQCYVPTSEDQTRWNGQPTVRFHLRNTCSDDIGITELYVDPQTFRPIAADGDIPVDTSSMTVAIEVRYGTVGQYTVPTEVRAHAVGHGWLFWARERADVVYTDYEFFKNAEFTRRQASAPVSGAKPPRE